MSTIINDIIGTTSVDTSHAADRSITPDTTFVAIVKDSTMLDVHWHQIHRIRRALGAQTLTVFSYDLWLEACNANRGIANVDERAQANLASHCDALLIGSALDLSDLSNVLGVFIDDYTGKFPFIHDVLIPSAMGHGRTVYKPSTVQV